MRRGLIHLRIPLYRHKHNASHHRIDQGGGFVLATDTTEARESTARTLEGTDGMLKGNKL